MLELKPERLAFDDFQDQTISICGKVFRADMSGALYWPSENALIVADLHLEKGSAFAARGQLVPPYDTRETLQRLADVIDRYEAGTVIALGDSLHDEEASERIGLEELEILQIMQEDREWIWVTGNHDPKIGERLGGSVVGDIEVEGIVLRHEPAAGRRDARDRRPLHPAAKLSLHGYTMRRPCFVGNGTPSGDAGVRNLRRRPQHPRRRVRAAVRRRRHARVDAGPGGTLPRGRRGS